MNGLWQYLSVKTKQKQIHSFGFWENLQRNNLLTVLFDLYHCTDLFPGQLGNSVFTCQWNPNGHNITFNKGIKRYLIPSVWSWILVELKLDRSLVVFGEEGSAKRTIVWRTIGPNGKNPPKIRSKNLWNWLIILMPSGTVWQILII